MTRRLGHGYGRPPAPPGFPPSSLPSDHPGYALWLDRAARGEHQETPPAPDIAIQAEFAYELLIKGFTEIQVKLAIQRRWPEQDTMPSLAYRKALDLLIEEQRAARPALPELVMAWRMSAIQGALARGDYGPAAKLIADAGAVARELDATNIQEDHSTLRVEVLPPGEGAAMRAELDLELEVCIQEPVSAPQPPQEGASGGSQDGSSTEEP